MTALLFHDIHHGGAAERGAFFPSCFEQAAMVILYDFIFPVSIRIFPRDGCK